MTYDDLSNEQKGIIDNLKDWLTTPAPFITVGGYAGTGKTTVIGVFRNELKNTSVAFCCFTGKASQVLKNKLIEANAIHENDYIGTIHSLMYKPVVEPKTGKILGWTKKDFIEQKLIVVDEASMVNREIWEDLLSYGVPIIAVGDHGQLPPVGVESFNLMASPDLRLETIHRQSENNPILKMATRARLNGGVGVEKYGPFAISYRTTDPERELLINNVFDTFTENTLVLCAMNRTRVATNSKIRRAILGKMVMFEEGIPMEGDRIICLKNIRDEDDPSRNIYNGMLGTIADIKEDGEHWYKVLIDFDDREDLWEGTISKHQFNQEKPLGYEEAQKFGIHYKALGNLFDFGYCLTVHKSQGSQADRVLLFAEYSSFMFREEGSWARWLYTGITRAVKELYVV